jgi:peptide/nickel transport system substrate-binding protein
MKSRIKAIISLSVFILIVLMVHSLSTGVRSADTSNVYLPMLLDNYPRTLAICLGQEPDSLYIYHGTSLAKNQVLQAVYDGPIDSRSYSHQPVILEKLPNLADGDATLTPITVNQGATVVDRDSQVVSLQPGVWVVPSGQTQPIEYTGGPIQMDQLKARFTLISGITWSDGAPLTSADSIYAFNVAADPDTLVPKFIIDRTASYAALDDRTMEWTGMPGFKDATYFLNFFGPLPFHLWQSYTALELRTAVVSAQKPIGWGPYIIAEWAQGEYIRLQKNPHYFRAGEGLPHFDLLVYRFVGDDADANINALLSGDCDVLDSTTGISSLTQDLLSLQSAGSLKLAITHGTVWEHLDFGIQHVDYDNGYNPASDRPDFFSDVRTRRAFAMCLDRQGLINAINFGLTPVLDSYIPPEHPLYDAAVAKYPFDVAGGSALLGQVGWVDHDGNPATPRLAQGVAGVPDGTPLVVSYETTTASLRQQVSFYLEQSLAQCGIQTIITLYPAAGFFADGPAGKLFGRRYDLAEFAWITGVEPPCQLYTSSQTPGPAGITWIPIMAPTDQPTFQGWGGQNNTGFYHPAYDATCDKAIQALPGQPEYVAGHQEAQAIFADQLPVIPLFNRLVVAASRSDLEGLSLDPTAGSDFWNIEAFGLKP